MFVFRKIWCGLFSCYFRFEFHPFPLLPTSCSFFTSMKKLLPFFTLGPEALLLCFLGPFYTLRDTYVLLITANSFLEI